MSEGECPECGKYLKNVENHMKRMHATQPVKLSLVQSQSFSKTYATRALVQMTEYDFRIVFANEKLQISPDAEAIVSDSMAILTPTAAVELSLQLNKYIENWQRVFGEIPPRSKESIFTPMEMET